MRLHGLTSVLAIVLTVTASESLVLAAARIEGHLTRADGSPIAGVTVVVRETQATTMSDAYGFNVKFRGFNGMVNRRVLVLIDGRDPAGVLLGAQEWGAYGVQPDDLAKIEVIRGPHSALYGSNAFNGVVNMVSKDARSAPGGDLHLTFGERGTAMVSGSQAGRLSASTFYRVFGAATRTDDFFQSRTANTEYGGLAPEVIAPPIDHSAVISGGARLAHYFG